MEEEKKNDLNIEMSEEIAEGIYSNFVVISHSASEFVLDFVSMLPGIPKPKVKSRILMNPQHIKRLLEALKDNINKYENNFGDINRIEENKLPLNFGGPAGEA